MELKPAESVKMLEKEKGLPREVPKMPLFHPKSRRLHLLLLVLIGLYSFISMRGNMGVGMTCMVNSTALVELAFQRNSLKSLSNTSTTAPLSTVSFISQKQKSRTASCHPTVDIGGDEPVVNDYGGTLIWTGDVQGWVFSSLFYGSLISVLPAGYLADTQSPKLLLTGACIVYVVGTALTPVIAVYGGWIPLFAMRVIMGMGDGIAMPSINKLVTSWIPIEEKSTAATIYTSGFSLAIIVGVPGYAYLCSTALKWPAIFYFCAIFGSIWLVFWHFFTTDTFHGCKNMSERERQYLMSKPELQKKNKKQKLQIPFKKMFTSPPFLNLLLYAVSLNIVVTFLHMYQPTFYKEVLFLSPVNNGIFNAIPPIVEIFVKFGWSLLMDHLKQKQVLTPTSAVKLSQFLHGVMISSLFVSIGYLADCENPLITLVLFCGVSAAMSLTAAGFFTSMLSIAPAYTGIISSSTMLTGILARVATPIIIPFFNKTGTLEEWRPIFFIISGTTVVSTLFFVVFGSGEVQEWAKNPYGVSSTKEELEEMKKENELEIERVRSDTLI